jgi:hypothetical protein
MYHEDVNLNHKKGVCADGVQSKQKPNSDLLPEWPQPQGIFSKGKKFHPSNFLTTVHTLYEKVMEHQMQPQNAANDDHANDYQLEDAAFSRMLHSRTVFVGGHAFFRLYDDLEFEGGSYEALISEIDGHRHLRLDCLQQPELIV